jgi:hypothetical protein
MCRNFGKVYMAWEGLFIVITEISLNYYINKRDLKPLCSELSFQLIPRKVKELSALTRKKGGSSVEI